jgi:hypothetical protein
LKFSFQKRGTPQYKCLFLLQSEQKTAFILRGPIFSKKTAFLRPDFTFFAAKF